MRMDSSSLILLYGRFTTPTGAVTEENRAIFGVDKFWRGTGRF